MPRAIPFLEFLDRHWRDAAAGLEGALPLGCLLDTVNPTSSSQRAAHVIPLLREDRATTGPVIVGRAPDCDVVFPSPSVSRRHATLERRDGRILLADAGSSAGTFVGSRRLAEGEAVALPADGATELWFGALGAFHLGPRALGDYLRRILEAPTGPGRHARRELDRPPPPARVQTDLSETWRPFRLAAPTHAEEAAQADAWHRGLTAIVELGRAVHSIRVVLPLDERGVRVFDADRDPDGLPAALRSLEGRRAGVERIEVTLRTSRAPVVVFRRGEAPAELPYPGPACQTTSSASSSPP